MSAKGKVVKPLGEILKARKIISDEKLRKALELQKDVAQKSGKKPLLGKILIANKLVTPEQIEDAVLEQKRSRVVEFKARSELEELYGPLSYHAGDDPNNPLVDPEHKQEIAVAETRDGHPFILVTQEFQESMFNNVLSVRKRVQELFKDDRGRALKITTLQVSKDVLGIYQSQNTAPVEQSGEKSSLEVEFENLIKKAYESNAVDLHFFRKPDLCRVRFRVWGALRDHEDWKPQKADDILSVGFSSFGSGSKYSHWKKNIRQRVRLKIRYSQHISLDCRYEHAPGDDGSYHTCIRIMANDKRSVNKQIDLTDLGFTRAQTKTIEAAASASSGMVILSGPTGSGKSTTLAGVVKFINRNDDTNVLTVESPIERELPAFQTSVSDDDEADPKEFAKAIKSTLRRDPDVLMVGEIRDEMSASAAATGVQTGHTLLTTVHAQSAIEIVERLSSPAMALPSETIASPSFLQVLIFQMLLPTLDDQSKIRLTSENANKHLDADERQRLESLVGNLDKVELYVRGKSPECPEGIGGMTICAEVVTPTEEMRKRFRKMELGEAMNVWLEEGRKINPGKPLDERVMGLRASSHAIGKMLEGRIDPRDVEAYFGHLNLLVNDFQ